jgi:hypothetical protein
MSLVEVRINRTKTVQHLSLTDVNFDQENFELKNCPVLVRLILTSALDFL